MDWGCASAPLQQITRPTHHHHNHQFSLLRCYTNSYNPLGTLQSPRMSSGNKLSIVANVLQVVTFADTVFCAGKSLYDFAGRYKNFTQGIPRLLMELQSLLSIIAYVRVYVEEFANSQFACNDGHTLPSISTILTLVEQDFRQLMSLLSEIACNSNDWWLAVIASSLRWARKEEDIAAAQHRLAQYTTNLTAALSISGR